MGADLICFITKGPLKLDSRKKTKAVAQIKRVVQLLVEVRKIYKSSENSEAAEHEIQKLDLTPLCHVWKDNQAKRSIRITIGDQSMLDDLWYLVELKPERLVEELFAVWHGSSTIRVRDGSSRPDPDDPKRQIVIAGELSWGDEPDGLGYQTLKAAFESGIADIFGIT